MYDKIRKLILQAYALNDNMLMQTCANRITWAAQFAQITKEECGKLADMVTGYYARELYYDRKEHCLRYTDDDQIAKWSM
jgi:hypothetical protein